MGDDRRAYVPANNPVVLRERAEKAEAEVARLTEALREAKDALNEIACAEDDWDNARAIARSSLARINEQTGENDG